MARHPQQSRRIRDSWDNVCFHAQQAAEKVLKALLVHRRIMPPHTHDLVALLDMCVGFDPTLAELTDDSKALTMWAVSSRYPGESEPCEDDGRRMIAIARRICDRILALLPSETNPAENEEP